MAEYIRSRYKLLPYIYQLWIAQEEWGEPVLRPLWYHWPESDWTCRCDDEYTLGNAILHAPIMDIGQRKRQVRLPEGLWYEWNSGRFISGDQTLTVVCSRIKTPLYFRSGSVIPMLPGIRSTNEKDLRRVDFFCVMSEGEQGRYRYCADDGQTLAYRDGTRSELELSYNFADGFLRLEVAVTKTSYGQISYRILIPSVAKIRFIEVNGERLPMLKEKLRFAGVEHKVMASEVLLN